MAGLLIALALAIKLLIPAGYMASMVDGRLAITICPPAWSAQAPVPTAAHLPANMAKAMAKSGPHHAHGEPSGHPEHQAHPEAPCAFAGLSTPALAGADPALLVTAILFVMMIVAHIVVRPSIEAPPRLRPPLRGPPALA